MHTQPSCDQCSASIIMGRFCHEKGCPNDGKRWEDDQWIRYRECRECGCDVRDGDVCDCTLEPDAENDEDGNEPTDRAHEAGMAYACGYRD